MKKIKLMTLVPVLALVAMVFAGFSTSLQVYANGYDKTVSVVAANEINGATYDVVYSYTDILNEYYQEYLDIYNNLDTDSILSFDEFHDAYYAQSTYTITEFIEALARNSIEEIIEQKHQDSISLSNSNNSFGTDSASSASSSGGDVEYPFNIGTSLPLDKTPNYVGFNFDMLPGDIIYDELMAKFFGYQGHTAIVEGNFVDRGISYWRVIESMKGPGVCRGVVDSDRLLEYQSCILRVTSATTTQRNAAVQFAKDQIGDAYLIQIWPTDRPLDGDVWMCSTLVWAAYRHQNNGTGIDIDYNGGAIWPKDIL